MTRLTVPNALVPAFTMIRELGEAEYSTFLDALALAAPSSRREDIFETIGDVSGLSRDDIKTVFEAIISSVRIGYARNLSIEEVASQIASSPKFDDPEQEQIEFSNRLLNLAKTQVARIYGKASALGAEHRCVYMDSKILTDLRPIFGDDPDEAPEGALMVHTLKLEFIDGDRHSNRVFVALDDEDLKLLEEGIERAKQKTHTLEETLSRIGLMKISPETE